MKCFAVLLIVFVAFPAWAYEPATAKTADYRAATMPDGVIAPEQLEYAGAFNVPAGVKGPMRWGYAACGLTYSPKGDPDGPKDGHPGSLFGVGHATARCVSEFSIPAPVLSKARDYKQLPYAKTLQPFARITTGTVNQNGGEFALRVHALGYMPAQGEQKVDKIYFSGWRSYQPTSGWTRGCFDVDLSKPNPAGMWQLAGHSAFTGVSAFMQIPKDWAAKHCPGMTLAYCGGINGTHGYGTGRGPAVVAAAPWKDGNPPKPGATLKGLTLLKYGDWRGPTVLDVQRADGWHGAAWVTQSAKSAVVFFGVKDIGESWYGYPKDDTGAKVFDRKPRVEGKSKFVNERGEPVEKVTGGRGWKRDLPRACIFFFNPADLADVADGKKKPGEPQPYARIDVSGLMHFRLDGLTGCGYDRANGVLYSFERTVAGRKKRGGEAPPIVHVWRLRPADA